MSSIDVNALLAEVSPAAPVGEDLSYDPEFLALHKLAEGKAETQWSAAEEPNWRDVRSGCIDLLKRTKDVRVITLLALAALKTDGLAGLGQALELLRGALEKYWDGIHPKLDDDGDPLERINAITALSPPPGAFGDAMMFRQRVKDAPLAQSPRLGKFGLRDVAIASGKAPAPANPTKPVADEKTINAAFDDTPPEQLKAVNDAAGQCVTAIREVERLLTERVGAGKAPDLSEFRVALTDAAAVTAKYMLKRGLIPTAGTEKGTDVSNPGDGSNSGVSNSQSSGGGGEIRSTQDVIATLDRICNYYERNEPSSPVPLLLKRARRLVAKSFMEIVRDLSPDALARLEIIGGTDSADGAAEK